ncbi:MAG: hypothetical protein B6D59_04680 [Campylobacteraceae bacterium 4484_4]|nr:MAG: hypothetical protein B6D59_04680 [Campylobacteraceae bacterium 4484_4]
MQKKSDIFNPENAYTVGVELEVRLLDKKTLMPRNEAAYFFTHLPDTLGKHIHKELLQSMVEIVTPVCESADEAADFITRALHTLAGIGAKREIVLAALATHPFEHKEDNEIIHDARYEAFAQELQIVLRNFLISGLHIHIGMPDSEAAIRSYNAAIRYMPIFLALSANSPYIQGEDSGLQSYRTNIFQRLPRAGIPQRFESYEAYCALIDQLMKTGTIESIKDVWWDVRIHQIFGTIELRVCDAFYDYERLRLIVLFFQALLLYASRHPVEEEFYQITKQNKWNAVRHGLSGKFIDGMEVMTIREKALDLIDRMDYHGIFEKLGKVDDIPRLKALLQKESIARKLRKIYQKTGDFRAVINEEIVR